MDVTEVVCAFWPFFCDFRPIPAVDLIRGDVKASSGELSHSPVGVLVKRFCSREPQHATDDAAAAQVPAAAAHVTPLPRMPHFQHPFRDQTAGVSSEDGPQASPLQVNGALSVSNQTSLSVQTNKRGRVPAVIEADLATHLRPCPQLPSAFVMHSKTGFACLNKHDFV